MKKLENMDFALNYRMGLESTDALSDFDACVWPLLQALGWRGLPRQVAEPCRTWIRRLI